MEDVEVDDVQESQSTTMLEHPIFVFWCESCGRECPGDDEEPCEVCGGRVQRHQRVLELPDEDVGLLSLDALRAALTDIAGSEEASDAALLLSECGLDPDVASVFPAFAAELADLHVPPPVQRALVSKGFVSLRHIGCALSPPSSSCSLSLELGLSPAVDVLLRRLWHVSREREAQQEMASSQSVRNTSASLKEELSSDDVCASKRKRALEQCSGARIGSMRDDDDDDDGDTFQLAMQAACLDGHMGEDGDEDFY